MFLFCFAFALYRIHYKRYIFIILNLVWQCNIEYCIQNELNLVSTSFVTRMNGESKEERFLFGIKTDSCTKEFV